MNEWLLVNKENGSHQREPDNLLSDASSQYSGWLFTYRTLPMISLVLHTESMRTILLITFRSQGFVLFLTPISRLRNKQNKLGYFTYRKSSKNCVDGTNSNGCINRLAEPSRLENAGWVVKYLQSDNSLALIKKPSIDGFKARNILSCLSSGASMKPWSLEELPKDFIWPLLLGKEQPQLPFSV